MSYMDDVTFCEFCGVNRKYEVGKSCAGCGAPLNKPSPPLQRPSHPHDAVAQFHQYAMEQRQLMGQMSQQQMQMHQQMMQTQAFNQSMNLRPVSNGGKGGFF